ncbi:MAG: methyltransferase domain-containing protein [Candidatus Diapherotrites archaeon]|nr:methyltransferase domain-containing protein [Candidatus Diapherotrites archaeon]
MIGFYLLGRLTDLARWEVRRIAQRRGDPFRSVSSRFVLVGSNDIAAYSRVAYSHLYGRVWFSFRRLSDFPHLLRSSGLQEYILHHGPYALHSIGSYAPSRLAWFVDGRVNLKSPATVVAVVRAGSRHYVLAPARYLSGKDFSPRDARNRPFFHPTAMNAREARLLVNLTGVQPDESFLDPFCGTGALLLEAGIVGARVFGVDRDERMVSGAEENLRFFGLSGNVSLGDAREVSGDYDAIATDVPYGRSSRVFAPALRELYRDAFLAMYSSLKRGRFAVIVADRDLTGLLERAGFYVDHVSKWYVHAKMTRRVHLCRK